MPGKHITKQQIRLYMRHRARHDTQTIASAKARISERTGRRIEGGEVGPGESQQRHWRTRKDPFVAVWDREVVTLLERQPALSATTLFEDLQDRHPGKFRMCANARSSGE
jgi:uncharacterized cupin superfamily protein